MNYNFTDYSHLTEGDYIDCINDCNRCVMSLIKQVHFNSNKPENMNIYISSIKGNYVMVYKDNAWQIQDKKEQINDLYDYNEVVLVNWYDEYKQKYPDIIKSFQRYLKNKDDSDCNKRGETRDFEDVIQQSQYDTRRGEIIGSLLFTYLQGTAIAEKVNINWTQKMLQSVIC